MQLENFSYELPQHLIAQYPLERRDNARLMVINRKKKTIEHDIFSNLVEHLPVGSAVVLNDSRVIPARLLGVKQDTCVDVEIFLLKRLSDQCSYEVLMRPMKKLKVGDKVVFKTSDVVAEVISCEQRIVRFNKNNLEEFIRDEGHMPLPPYIKRPDEVMDHQYYQTVFARNSGSVAAPTAGLHFTAELLSRIHNHGHQIEKLTLHVNYATFKPVEVSDVREHKMHSEYFDVTPRVLKMLEKARCNQRPVVAVGTTACRVLETVGQRFFSGGCKSVLDEDLSKGISGNTDIFICPGYKFQLTDVLITNFHQPYSTLLMLVYAFGGENLIRRAYKEAIDREYRFFSYGDAMIIV